MLQTQTVAEDTLALIIRLMASPRLNEFILVGGTALALTLGHRDSIDIDLFTTHSFEADSLAKWLGKELNATNIRTLKNGVFCYIDNVKIDLITHAYPEIEPHRTIEGIRIMSLTDIAAMKLHAIVQSGKRLKDFTDVYFMLEHMPLSAMYAAYEKKYFPDGNKSVARLALNDTSGINFNDEVHLLDRTFDWPAINNRVQTALQSPQKMFRERTTSASLVDHKTTSSFQQPEVIVEADNPNEGKANNIILSTTQPIHDKALLNYLQDRQIPLDLAQKFCCEVLFSSDGKRQKAVGFENRSGGFELHSKSFSGSSFPKDVTILNDPNKYLSVFDNYLDFLSYAAIRQNNDAPLPGCLILNSVFLFEKCRPLMERHEHIFLFLKRDPEGQAAVAKALDWNRQMNAQKYTDSSKLYSIKGSLNEWFISQSAQIQKPTRKLGRRL